MLCNQPYNAVEGFPLTEQYYDTCIDLLKDSHGIVDIINKHTNNLLNMEQLNC